ncbi:unnamed protein product [Leuciscus chuanchicus]
MRKQWNEFSLALSLTSNQVAQPPILSDECSELHNAQALRPHRLTRTLSYSPDTVASTAEVEVEERFIPKYMTRRDRRETPSTPVLFYFWESSPSIFNALHQHRLHKDPDSHANKSPASRTRKTYYLPTSALIRINDCKDSSYLRGIVFCLRDSVSSILSERGICPLTPFCLRRTSAISEEFLSALCTCCEAAKIDFLVVLLLFCYETDQKRRRRREKVFRPTRRYYAVVGNADLLAGSFCASAAMFFFYVSFWLAELAADWLIAQGGYYMAAIAMRSSPIIPFRRDHREPPVPPPPPPSLHSFLLPSLSSCPPTRMQS